jgi:hypothetical protein
LASSYVLFGHWLLLLRPQLEVALEAEVLEVGLVVVVVELVAVLKLVETGDN